MQREAAAFACLENRAPTFKETVKEDDNYGDSSLQFVLRAQLISGERRRVGVIILQRVG